MTDSVRRWCGNCHRPYHFREYPWDDEWVCLDCYVELEEKENES